MRSKMRRGRVAGQRPKDMIEAIHSLPYFIASAVADKDFSWSCGGTVTIVTKSGARYSSTVDAPGGSGPRGIRWTDVDAKFRFDQVKSASELTRLLS